MGLFWVPSTEAAEDCGLEHLLVNRVVSNEIINFNSNPRLTRTDVLLHLLENVLICFERYAGLQV